MADTNSRAGTNYFSKEILDWTAQLHAPHDASLQRAFDAPTAHSMPAIQLGQSECKMASMLLKLAGARRVVELGTLAGYSALRLVEALPADGRLWTIECDAHHAAVARQNIANANEQARIEVLVGRGADALPTLEKHGPFCAVFIDADKESYDLYGRWAAANLREGGLLLGDNAFLFGELLDDSVRGRAMRRFHTDAREAFDTVCIPTPDGMLLGIRR
jgi:predicted O-methyltransferase YrrM